MSKGNTDYIMHFALNSVQTQDSSAPGTSRSAVFFCLNITSDHANIAKITYLLFLSNKNKMICKFNHFAQPARLDHIKTARQIFLLAF